MVRIRYALVSIGIVILLAACNAPAQEDAATATQKDLLPDVTLEPGPADPTITVGVTPPAVEMQEPTFEFDLPTSEPPGETLPAQDRLQAGDDLSLEYIEMISAELGWAIGGDGGQADSILRSEDGGLSWDEVSPPEPIDNVDLQMAVAGFLDESSAWVVYHSEVDSRMSVRLSQKVWHTSDAGRHWQASAPVSLEFIGSLRSPAWIQFTSPDQGWLLANYGGAGMQRYPVYLLHSDDAGSHWEILEDPYDGLWLQSCPKTGWDWSSSGTGILTLGLCPFESAEIRLTSDAGVTWGSIRLPFPPGEEERFGFNSCSAHSPVILGARELLLASDCPLWEDNPETVHLLYRTQDFGVSWQIQEYPGGELFIVGEGVILALGRDLYRSEDSGITWTLIKQVSWDGQFSFIDAQNGWAIARNEDETAFVHTQDGGTTWQLIKPILIP